MKRAILVQGVLLAGMAVTVVASETESQSALRQTGKPSQEKSADVQDVSIAKRQIKFERFEKDYPMKLFRADPKLLQQSHVAIILLDAPRMPLGSGRRFPREPVRLPADLSRLTWYRGSSLFGHPGIRRAEKPARKPAGKPFDSKQYFKQLASKIPKTRLPPKNNLAFFTEEADDGYVQFQPRGAGYSEFRILAPSPERAAELAQTLVQLFDEGLTAPIQQFIPQQIQAAKKKIQNSKSARAKAQKEQAEYKKKLEASEEEISRDELSSLKTQRRLLSVDLAGVKARIGAAAKILTQRNQLGTSRIEQVENIKITAEIELAGLVARQKTLDEIIQSARQRIEFKEKAQRAGEMVGSWKIAIRTLQSRVRNYEAMIQQYGPFQLPDGKVVIRPIQWTK
jgi:hypothetical protein